MANVSALSVRAGDVVIADFPGVEGTKRRPALVVSSATYHLARPDTILCVLTGQVASAVAPTDYHLQDWRAAGLRTPTAFRAFLVTLPRQDLVAVIGHLSDRDWSAVQARLQLAISA